MKLASVAATAFCGFLVSCAGTDPAPPHLARLEVQVTPAGPVLARDTARARLVGFDQYDALVPIGPVTWGVGDSAIATIDASGLVRTTTNGSTPIIGQADGLSASVTLIVAGTRHAGAIDTSQVWTAAASPHVVAGRLAVGAPGGVVLTVQGGATVVFEPHAGLDFGMGGPATLNVPGPGPTAFDGRIAFPGSWFGLSFKAAGQSTLRNVTLRHCGEQQAWTGCLVLRDTAGAAPTILIDSVAIRDSRNGALFLEGNARFAPGSRLLSLLGVRGHVATLRARAAATFPLGGQFNAVDTFEIRLSGDTIADSVVWGPIAARWRVSGSIWIEGVQSPTLTLRPGRYTFAFGAGVWVGQGAPGSLRVLGVAPDSQVVLDALAGDVWDGIHFGPGTFASFLKTVLIQNGRGGESPFGAAAVFMNGAAPVFDSVRIIGADDSHGVIAHSGGRFGAASREVVITATARPMLLAPDVAFSIPSGTYTGNQHDVIGLFNDEITTSQTWSHHGVPYLVGAEVVVEGSVTPVLTLAAGTVVQFLDFGRFRVGALEPGGLRALGTAAAPVRFTAAAFPPVAGSWKGIVIGTLADSATLLEHSVIEFAGAPDSPPDGAIRVERDIGEIIRNVLIRNSAACGILRGSGSSWTTDFTAPHLANQFVGNGGNAQCGP